MVGGTGGRGGRSLRARWAGPVGTVGGACGYGGRSRRCGEWHLSPQGGYFGSHLFLTGSNGCGSRWRPRPCHRATRTCGPRWNAEWEKASRGVGAAFTKKLAWRARADDTARRRKKQGCCGRAGSGVLEPQAPPLLPWRRGSRRLAGLHLQRGSRPPGAGSHLKKTPGPGGQDGGLRISEPTP